jgi:hypothetical protein
MALFCRFPFEGLALLQTSKGIAYFNALKAPTQIFVLGRERPAHGRCDKVAWPSGGKPDTSLLTVRELGDAHSIRSACRVQRHLMGSGAKLAALVERHVSTRAITRRRGAL